ncbi:hypothetical protein CSKR_204059 [Clonorchis sinensis]|uniref:Uncharacterized protein n=1 Tax=Clonorchis sinensis TaxID=79923 RepID=A0A8T1M163_CLOSI|nr:hypothetical protein CSKR_204059 [Clonorchis sinensis]
MLQHYALDWRRWRIDCDAVRRQITCYKCPALRAKSLFFNLSSFIHGASVDSLSCAALLLAAASFIHSGAPSPPLSITSCQRSWTSFPICFCWSLSAVSSFLS